MIKKWKEFNENYSQDENDDYNINLEESLFGFEDEIKEIENKYGIISLSDSIYKLLNEKTSVVLDLDEEHWFNYQDIIISVDTELFHFSISYYEQDDDLEIPMEDSLDLAYAEGWGDYVSTVIKLIEQFMKKIN